VSAMCGIMLDSQATPGRNFCSGENHISRAGESPAVNLRNESSDHVLPGSARIDGGILCVMEAVS
jgi:hypothetical protein